MGSLSHEHAPKLENYDNLKINQNPYNILATPAQEGNCFGDAGRLLGRRRRQHAPRVPAESVSEPANASATGAQCSHGATEWPAAGLAGSRQPTATRRRRTSESPRPASGPSSTASLPVTPSRGGTGSPSLQEGANN